MDLYIRETFYFALKIEVIVVLLNQAYSIYDEKFDLKSEWKWKSWGIGIKAPGNFFPGGDRKALGYVHPRGRWQISWVLGERLVTLKEDV